MNGIARTWRALATRQGADAYVRYFDQTLRPELAALAGYRGAVVLRQDGDQTRIVVITRWASLDAVRAFAGDAVMRAVVEPEARALLLSFDDSVEHFEVVLDAS